MGRMEVLNDLISFSESPEALSKALSQYEWDYEGVPFIVKASQVRKVLEEFLAGKYSAQELEAWANLIECREDLEFEESKHNLIENIINHLANPVLHGEISHQYCKTALDTLEK